MDSQACKLRLTVWHYFKQWISAIIPSGQWVNSLWPRDTIIWQNRSRSALPKVMTCCLMAPNHYLHQCWLSSKVFCSIQLRAISQEVLMNLIRNKCSEITILKLLPDLPGVNDLKGIIKPFMWWPLFNTLRPRQMDAISQTTFSNAFSRMKMFEFR